MESLRPNYKQDAEIENELDAVEIKNFVTFDVNGHHKHRKCAYCYGPLLGHIQPKCPKVKYEQEAVEQFEIYLENLEGVYESLERGVRKYLEKMQPREREREPRVTEVRKQRQVPEWRGGDFELWKKEIADWYRTSNSTEQD